MRSSLRCSSGRSQTGARRRSPGSVATAATSTNAWPRSRRSRRFARRRSRPASARWSLDPEHELVPPRGGPLRRVRLELLRFPPVRRPAVVDRHRVPDERRAPLDRGRDRVRVARRRRRPDRRHDVPDLPRPVRARGLQRDRAGPDRHLDAVPANDLRPPRAVLRRPVREPEDRMPRPARDARDPRPAHRLRGRVPGRERPVRLHAVLASRTTTRGRTRTVPTPR